MSNPYRDRLLGIGVISKRTRDVVREGKSHPESGKPFKSVTNEAGTVTEHGSRLSGVSDRQDATVHIRDTIRTNLGSHS